MKGPPLDGTAADGICKDPGDTVALELQAEVLAVTVDPVDSGGDSGLSQQD